MVLLVGPLGGAVTKSSDHTISWCKTIVPFRAVHGTGEWPNLDRQELREAAIAVLNRSIDPSQLPEPARTSEKKQPASVFGTHTPAAAKLLIGW